MIEKSSTFSMKKKCQRKK